VPPIRPHGYISVMVTIISCISEFRAEFGVIDADLW
jgi:hypothetical protein